VWRSDCFFKDKSDGRGGAAVDVQGGMGRWGQGGEADQATWRDGRGRVRATNAGAEAESAPGRPVGAGRRVLRRVGCSGGFARAVLEGGAMRGVRGGGGGGVGGRGRVNRRSAEGEYGGGVQARQ